ncbi:RHS repeat-associated core domain-containing protein [Sinomonas gamaensis]|uniref:RHS repeat-associated core domain-containing protein n=1 Tax=Sinomonas gamaensis TaxID=2565624 RepID=UPI001485D874
MTDPDGRASKFTYDAAGDRITAADPLGDTTSYTYDAIWRMLTSKTPRGNTTSYAYDADSRLTAVTDPLGHVTSYGYDPTGLRTTVTDANSHTTTTAYDPDGHPTKVTNSDGTFSTTAYDVDGNATSTTDANGHTTTYAYDPLDRITSSTDPINRSTTYAYDKAGHLTGVTNPAGKTATNTYDPAGNKTGTTYSDGTTHAECYTYTAHNQQATMADATGTTASTYDSLGRLTAQTNGNGQTVGYDAGNPVEQLDATGSALYYQHDQCRSTRLLTDSSGAVVATYTYDAYGNLAAKTGTADTVLRWNGQVQDTDTRLYYLRARYYDPQTAQFLSTDPLAALTKAMYDYASNNPLNSADPTGLDDWWNPATWASDTWKVVATVGVIIGAVALAATGVGLVAELGAAGVAGAAAIAETAGTVAMVAGGASTALDGAACLWHHASPGETDTSACAGFTLGLLTLGLGSVAKAGGEAVFGPKEVAAGNRAGWDVGGGIFGTAGFAIDALSCLKVNYLT